GNCQVQAPLARSDDRLTQLDAQGAGRRLRGAERFFVISELRIRIFARLNEPAAGGFQVGLGLAQARVMRQGQLPHGGQVERGGGRGRGGGGLKGREKQRGLPLCWRRGHGEQDEGQPAHTNLPVGPRGAVLPVVSTRPASYHEPNGLV